jgi:type I restriction enzyme S subunit
VVKHRKEFIEIDELMTYKRCRVQLHAQGIVLRDLAPGSEIKTKRQQVCRSGEFLVAEIDAKVGGFGIVPPDLDGAIVSSHYFLFTIDECALDRRFLDYYCRTPGFRDQVAAQGSTNYAAIRPAHVLAYTIPLPPLAEQRRIVARIEALAGKIAEARGLRRGAVEEANRLYLAGLAAAMDSTDSAWRHGTVDDVIITMDAGWSPQCEDAPAAPDAWGVLKTTAVQWSAFQPEQNKALRTTMAPRPELAAKAGDVLVTRAGPRKRVGVVAAVRNNHPRLMISDKLIRLRPDSSKVESRFLELSLCSPLAQEYLVQRKTGLADAQVNISQRILSATPIAYPQLPEQRRIVAYLDGLQTKVDALKALQAETAAELDALLPAVLDEAFKGEL